MARSLRLAFWREFVSLCLLFLALAGIVQPSVASDLQVDTSIVARQILVVLDPRLSTVRAAAIARRDPAIAVQSVIATLGGPVEIKRVLMQDFVADIDAIRKQNPLAPEVLLSEYFVLTYPEGTDMAQRLALLKANPLVLSAEINTTYTLSSSYYLDQNSYASVGTYEWGLTSTSPLNFPPAWLRINGNAYVADLDNGIYWQANSTHADLQANFRPHFSRRGIFITDGQQFVPFDSQFGEPASYHGHGTHTSGLIAAKPQGSVGMTGTCPGCSLMMIRITDDYAVIHDDIFAASITEAVKSGAQILSMSFGSPAYNTDGTPYRPPDYCQSNPNTLICVALSTATNRAVSIVAASGNFRAALQFPANQAYSIAVGGLQKDPSSGAISFWTDGYVPPSGPCPNSGQGVGESGSNCSDSADIALNRFQVVAPAKDVLSTFYYGATWNPGVHCGDQYDPYPLGDPLHSPPTGSSYLISGYGTCTGTSMATPISAGLVHRNSGFRFALAARFGSRASRCRQAVHYISSA